MDKENLSRNIDQLGSNHNLLLDLKTIDQAFTKRNIKIKLFDDRSLKDFLQLPTEQKNRVLSDLLRYVEFLPKNQKMTFQAEKEILAKHMSILNLEPYDDVYSFLEKGDVVEIYDQNFLQLFRNWEFASLCSYTYLDLATRPFFELFDRPQQTTNAIVGRVQEVLALAQGTKKYGIMDHLLKERFLDARTVFKIELKYASPLKDKLTGKPCAFLSTLKASVVVEGDDSNKFAWI